MRQAGNESPIQNCGKERFGARLLRMIYVSFIGLGGVGNPSTSSTRPQRSQAVLVSSRIPTTWTAMYHSWKAGPAPAQTNAITLATAISLLFHFHNSSAKSTCDGGFAVALSRRNRNRRAMFNSSPTCPAALLKVIICSTCNSRLWPCLGCWDSREDMI